MRFTVPAWSVPNYAHDRRKHRHQCRVCRRNINAGEAVFMAKVKAKKTRAIHEACADKQIMPEYATTWREVMREWAFTYQLGCYGYSETNPRHYEKVAQLRAQVGTPVLR